MGSQLTLGVDTHLDVHVAALLDERGALLGVESFDTTPDGYRNLLTWAASHGEVVLAGVEGTGSYGAGLTRHLHAEGVKVLEKAAQVEAGSGIIRSRLAMAYAAIGQNQDALRSILEAAKLSPRSVVVARLASELLASQGRVEESVAWEAEAKKREVAAGLRPIGPGRP